MKIVHSTNSELASSPLSNIATYDCNDPTLLGKPIQMVDQDAVLLESKPLRARQVVVRLADCLLAYQTTNSRIRMRSFLKPGFMALVVFGPRSSGSVNGLSIGAGCALLSSAGIKVEFVVEAGYESISFILPTEILRVRLMDGQREDQVPFISGFQLLRTNPASTSGLYKWGRSVADTAIRKPEVFDSSHTQSVAQNELMEGLLTILDSAVDAKPTTRDITRQARSQSVQTAEDYALAHTDERLQVSDLSRAAGVSERTLQYAFKEVMGMTPVAYLTRLRLHRVRRALLASSSKQTTVTEEALRAGFWHLGEFSKAYRECFGERPSCTLRNKSGS